MHRICFVILHYLSFEATRDCIDSIHNTFAQSSDFPYHIVVVDNASPNDSYSQLSQHCNDYTDVTLLQAPENLGFAKGNNLGYQYALKTLHADFVIMTNNDTEFHQADFFKVMLDSYEQHHCALIGPDILNINGYHQNPYRPHLLTDQELSRWMRNRRLWLLFLNVDKYLHLTEHIGFFRNFYNKRAAAGRPLDNWQTAQHDVVLQGACILLTPLFTATFNDYAFYPGTFMYCEEDILAFLCNKKGLGIYYTPDLQIIHKESVSTSLSRQTLREKDLFLTRNMLASLKIFQKLRKQP